MDRLIIWGAGGHAVTVADAVRRQGLYEIAGFLDDVNPARKGEAFLGSRVLGGGEKLAELRSAGIRRAIVAIGDNPARHRLCRVMEGAGFLLAGAIHPGAILGGDVQCGPGTLVAAGCVINPGARIGSAVIVNTGATVDHETVLGDTVHLAPGVHVAGRVHIGEGTFLGVGACVIDHITIGAWSVVGAGAVVLRDLPARVVAYGMPARVGRTLGDS